jgi:hypothetical protein
MEQNTPAGVTFYVAENGYDASSGNHDAPFATLERARDAIRHRKKTDGLPKGGVDVEIGGGTYYRKEPFALEATDSGEPDAPVVYRARKDETVRLVGGVRVTNFEPVRDAWALERLVPEAREHVVQADLRALGVSDFGAVNSGGLELFFNDKPMTLARWPQEGFIRISGLLGGEPVDVRGTKGDATGKFFYAEERPNRWVGEKDAWVHGYWFWDWSDQRHPVEAIDSERKLLSVKPPYHGYGYRVGQWFYGFNLLCELDTPGEWYLDRETGTLYFYPPSPIEDGNAVVSVIPTLVTMNDVSHVAVEHLTLEAARGTAITMTGGTENAVVGCTIRNVGSWAVIVNGGSAHRVAGCDIYDVGDGGVSLNGGDRPTLEPAKHVADNNDIHDYGRWNRMYQPAISLSGVGNVASHNRLHDAPHIGILFSGNDHVLEYNEMFNVCHESNDAGAIYSGRDWTMRGTVIRYNYLHDITGFENRGCVGVYLDDMFCGTLIYGNLFYRVTRAAFIGGGRDCRIENNIFVDCVPSIHVDARAMGWAGYHVGTTMTDRLNDMPYKNALWSSRYPELVNILDDEPASPKRNVVARNISVGGKWDGVYGEARPYTMLTDNLVDVDPGFVGTPPENWRLKSDSPAWKLGFREIPVENIGLYASDERARSPITESR